MGIATKEEKMQTMEALKLARKRIEESKLGDEEVGKDVLVLFDTCYDLVMKDAIQDGNKSNYARRFAFDVLVCFTHPGPMLELFDLVHALAQVILHSADRIVVTEEDEPINGKGIELLKVFEGGSGSN